jgi:hypothetical protein
VAALDGLSNIYEELLQLSRHKQQLIVHNRVDELITVTAQETKAVTVIHKMETEVNRLADECRAGIGITPNPASTLADLIQAVHQADWKTSLGQAAERLSELVGKLKEQNNRNQMLVRDSLNYIGFQIDLFTAPFENVTYSPTKSAPTGLARRTFDTKA